LFEGKPHIEYKIIIIYSYVYNYHCEFIVNNIYDQDTCVLR